jgi:hypothetical protein
MPEPGFTGSKQKLKKSGRENMELDDFRRKNIKPKIVISGGNNNSEKLDDLISLFRSYQEKQKRKSILFSVYNLVLALIYLSIMSRMNGPAETGYLLLGAGFILGALYLRLRYKPLSDGIYSLPLSEFLSRAEGRISYFNLYDYLIVLPILTVLGTGGGIVFITSLLKYTDKEALLIIIWVIFFISLCLFGFRAGRKNWEKEYGDFFRKINDARLNLGSREGTD